MNAPVSKFIVEMDDAYVDQWSVVLKDKMAASRAKGREGWYDTCVCPDGALPQMLREHVAKGDPRDVGVLAMMCWARGESTASTPAGPRVYISGPMSNYHGLNRDAFNTEAARLLALGYQVENPADVVLPDGATWADFMRADIPRLLACSHIRMLDGWTMSKGARLEHHIAISLGLEVLTDCDLQEQK